MNKAVVIIGALGAAGAAYALTRSKPPAGPTAPPPPPAPPVQPAGPVASPSTAGAGVPATPAPAPVNVGAPTLPPVLSGASQALSTVASTAAMVGVGLKAADAIGTVVEKVAGEGAGNLARVFAPAAVGFGVKGVTEKALTAIGVPAQVTKVISQTTGIAAATGGLGVPIKLTAEVVSAGIGLVAGKKVEQDVRSVFRAIDPSNSKNITSKPFSAIGSAVKSLGSLFGKK
ncbi:hypothetical protein JRI60_26890 [Archangium violaceum]|uniref:hypothetical protein n=1 Tax=Archangium violaceum TaxID=83451 RepID=UPI0019503551|nr:hypothetical protein [Archangium violaceum]QRN92839.1 hypothetical protein JRI60_26890 [Archangium violaceum]